MEPCKQCDQEKLDEINEAFRKLEEAEAAYKERFGEIPSITERMPTPTPKEC